MQGLKQGLKGLALFALICIAAGSPCRAAVKVVFLHPESYSDAGLYNGHGRKGREAALQGIREHLDRLGKRYLKPGQTLKVEVLDVDLAGRFEWWRPYAYDVRILRDSTWPRMKIRYALDGNGRNIACPEELIADQSYLLKAAIRVSTDPLRYEKAMLDDWFRARIIRAGGCGG